MEVGRGSGVVVARVCWCWSAGSFVDAASPGKFPRCPPHWSQLEARPVPVCPCAPTLLLHLYVY